MPAGKLDKRVTIQAPAAGRDSAGQPLTTWTDLATVWADISYQAGYEQIKADSVINKLRVAIRIRKRADVTANMRIAHGGHLFNIQAIVPDVDGNPYLDLICEVLDV